MFAGAYFCAAFRRQIPAADRRGVGLWPAHHLLLAGVTLALQHQRAGETPAPRSSKLRSPRCRPHGASEGDVFVVMPVNGVGRANGWLAAPEAASVNVSG